MKLNKLSAALVQKFVVLGLGKTATDAVVHLQDQLKVKPENITWVVPQDVWMFARNGGGPRNWLKAVLERGDDREADGNMAAVWASMEQEKRAHRVLQDSMEREPPVVNRAALIDEAELVFTKRVGAIIREGRVASIEAETKEKTRLVFAKKTVREFESGTVFVGGYGGWNVHFGGVILNTIRAGASMSWGKFCCGTSADHADHDPR